MKNKKIPDNLTKALLQLNLTEKEIATYITLLKNKPLGVQAISRETGINRVSIYSAIDELKIKGLLSETRQGKKKLFVAESPERLKFFLEEKKENLFKKEKLLDNLVLPLLKAINISEEKRPQIKFFEGIQGIYKIYDDYILKNKEIWNCGSYDTATQVIPEALEVDYFDIIRKNKIIYRVILEDTPLNRKFSEIGKGAMHSKFLPKETKIPGDVIVSGNLTALISYENKTAVLIEDAIIAGTVKVFLQFMWDRL